MGRKLLINLLSPHTIYNNDNSDHNYDKINLPLILCRVQWVSPCDSCGLLQVSANHIRYCTKFLTGSYRAKRNFISKL